MDSEIEYAASGEPVIDQFCADDFVDLLFRIAESSDDGQHYRWRLTADYDGELVGLQVQVVKNLQAGFDTNMDLIKSHVYRRGVQFERSGPESDRLVQLLATFYGAARGPLKMVDTETFTAIVLEQGEIDLMQQRIRVKLFGRDGAVFAEDDYYESFLKIDLEDGLVMWSEKDTDYRKPLLRALGVFEVSE